MKLNPRIVNAPQYPMAQLAVRKAELVKQGKKIYDFGTGDPIEPTPEFIRVKVNEGVPKVSQYPSVRGTKAHRDAMVGYLSRRFGVTIDPETQVLPTTGSKEAMYNIPFLMLNPEDGRDTIVGPEPGYPVMERGAIIAGAKYHPIQLSPKNNFLLDLSTIPESVLKRTAMAWICYPHNPTGAECTREYFERQIEVARKFDFLLCSDECYVDIYFGDTPPPSVLEVTSKGVLAFFSCSKRSAMTAYRSGFIAGDPEVISAYTSFRHTVGTAPPPYTESAATAAWNDDAHVEERRNIFRAKMELFQRFFTSHGISFVPTKSTFYLWAKPPDGSDGMTYAKRLLNEGIIVSPGEFFGAGCKEWFRLALVPLINDCHEAIEVWKRT